jgi:hypothetical protein
MAPGSITLPRISFISAGDDIFLKVPGSGVRIVAYHTLIHRRAGWQRELVDELPIFYNRNPNTNNVDARSANTTFLFLL